MAPVYSTRFLAVQGLAGTSSFEVPAGFVAVIRDIDAYASTDLTAGRLYVKGPGDNVLFFNHWGLGDEDIAEWRGRQICFEGESFVADSPDIPIDVAISGYLLTAP
jgi:hypothetical protein